MTRIGSVLLLGFALLGALVTTGDARDIAANTITADRLNISTRAPGRCAGTARRSFSATASAVNRR